MKYIGLDCHKQYDHATMIDTKTGEVKAKRLTHNMIYCVYLIIVFFRFIFFTEI